MIELRQLVGKQRTKFGILDVPFEMDSIVENGRRIGFVARHKGAPITLLRPVPQSVMTEVEARVTARDGTASKVKVAPQLTIEDVNNG